MVDLDLRHERRAAVVDRVTDALRGAVPGGDVQLRGSLATGEADQFSDIDLLWLVPADRFPAAIACVREIVAAVAPVSSLRVDPDFERSSSRRLIFVQLANLPLFWRVDLDVRCSTESLTANVEPAAPYVPTSAWSPAASAVANAVAAVKAVSRGRLTDARGLLERGFDRIGEHFHPAEGWPEAVTRLAHAAAAVDPGVRDVAREVADLAEVLLAATSPPRSARPR